jgi:hypothetical protein
MGNNIMLKNKLLKLQDELSGQSVAGLGLQRDPSTSFNLFIRKVNLGYICEIQNPYPGGAAYVFTNKKDLMMGIELLIPDIDHE